MNYPLQLSFKILALARQLSVVDAGGTLIFYVKQKAFKLKESVTVFRDAAQTDALYSINASRILDFSASYQFTDRQGKALGAVRRRGMRSMWKAHYEITDEHNNLVMTIGEESAWIKVFDAIFGEIPIVGIFSGYVFHPAYLVSRPTGAVVLRLAKQPAFLEGKFAIEKIGEMSETEEVRGILSLIMLVLLERGRG